MAQAAQIQNRAEAVKQAVDAAWEYVEAVEDVDELRYGRKKAKMKAALEGITDEEAFGEVQARKSGNELETLIAAKEDPRRRRLSEAHFSAEQIALTLDLLRADRSQRPTADEVVQVVTMGPETDGNDSRDTSVVVRDRFAAKHKAFLLPDTLYIKANVYFKRSRIRCRSAQPLT